MSKLQIYFDGACNNLSHPPFMGIGIAVLLDGVEQPHLCHSEMTGIGTSNVAEWQAMVKSLEIAIKYCEEHKDTQVHIFGDSQLIVYQFKGHWECRKRHLKVYYEQAQNLRRQMGGWLYAVSWIPREQNKLADKLSKKAFLPQK